MFDNVSVNVKQIILEKSRALAHELKSDKVHPEHVLRSLLDCGDCVAATYLGKKANIDQISEAALELAKKLPATGNAPADGIPFSDATKVIIDQMANEAIALGAHLVGTEHLLMALVASHEPTRRLLKERFDTTYGQIREALRPVPEAEGENDADAADAGAGTAVPGAPPKTVRVNPIMGAVFFTSSMTAKDIEVALFAIEQIKGVAFSQPMPVPTDRAAGGSGGGIVPGRFTDPAGRGR